MDPNAPNITVTEPVYDTDGSRVFLAAAIGDQLSAADAKRLQVGANGKSSNGITPAETLHVSDEVVQPGAAGQDDDAERARLEAEATATPPAPEPETTTAVVSLDDFDGLNAKDAQKAVAAYDADTLDAAEAFEKGRETPRTSVLGAIDKRRQALSEAE